MPNAAIRGKVRGGQIVIKWSVAEWQFGQRTLSRCLALLCDLTNSILPMTDRATESTNSEK